MTIARSEIRTCFSIDLTAAGLYNFISEYSMDSIRKADSCLSFPSKWSTGMTTYNCACIIEDFHFGQEHSLPQKLYPWLLLTSLSKSEKQTGPKILAIWVPVTSYIEGVHFRISSEPALNSITCALPFISYALIFYSLHFLIKREP